MTSREYVYLGIRRVRRWHRCRLLPTLGLRNNVVNVELFTVVQAVVADRTASVLLFGQLPLSPSREKFRFPGPSLFPIGAQCGVIWRRIVADHDMPLDRRPWQMGRDMESFLVTRAVSK